MIKRGLSRLGVAFLYLVSLFPYCLLYIISDVIYIVLYYIIHYRRNVVYDNLNNAFPEKTAAGRLKIEKAYYRYLGDLIVETIKLISVSQKELQRRVIATNPELV